MRMYKKFLLALSTMLGCIVFNTAMAASSWCGYIAENPKVIEPTTKDGWMALSDGLMTAENRCYYDVNPANYKQALNTAARNCRYIASNQPGPISVPSNMTAEKALKFQTQAVKIAALKSNCLDLYTKTTEKTFTPAAPAAPPAPFCGTSEGNAANPTTKCDCAVKYSSHIQNGKALTPYNGNEGAIDPTTMQRTMNDLNANPTEASAEACCVIMHNGPSDACKLPRCEATYGSVSNLKDKIIPEKVASGASDLGEARTCCAIMNKGDCGV